MNFLIELGYTFILFIEWFIDWLINFRFDLESPESEKLTDSVSEKEEKEIDEVEAESKVNIQRRKRDYNRR